jgi:hypothetical protein
MDRAPSGASIATHVRFLDRRSNARVDKTFTVERGDDDNPKVVEFDAAPGTYFMEVTAPKYGCSAGEFVSILADHDRSIDVTFAPGPPPIPQAVLFQGSSPQSFLYVKPTFVLFDKNSTACNKPVGEPIPLQVTVENDGDAYYAWLAPDPSVQSQGPFQLALRLKTATHQYHYVRVPVPFPMPWGGWPNSVTFDVTQDEVDGLASQPVNTLLCLHLWETKVYF